jgi:hypothetical protein
MAQLALESFDFQTGRFWIWVCVGYFIFLVGLQLHMLACQLSGCWTTEAHIAMDPMAATRKVKLFCGCAVCSPDGTLRRGPPGDQPAARKGDHLCCHDTHMFGQYSSAILLMWLLLWFTSR